MEAFHIDHKSLSLDDVKALLDKPVRLHLSDEVVEKVRTNRRFLDERLKDENKAIYGINTGFGSLCNTIIPDEELSDLQVNLVRSHACGTGPVIDDEITRLILLLKVKSLSYGYSGVNDSTIESLCHFFNNDILPIIHEQGSLGASGDLAPLAHLTLSLMGEGTVKWNKTILPSLEAIANTSGKPLILTSKEGLALLNGTQFMNAHLVYCLIEGFKLWEACHHIAALSLEAFNCRMDPFFEGLGSIRPHKGQIESAQKIRTLLADSGQHTSNGLAVQDPYSFRCIPQVHGASYTTMMHCKTVAETELNSVTDNPIVFDTDERIISGGNFHGQELAMALDFLAIALSELGNISERRTYLMVSGTRGLPPYLSTKPGTQSGFMIPQYTAASIVSQNKQLCSPASVDSIPSSNGQEDHVSMGANAATKCKRVLDNLRTILAIELMTAAQAWDFRDGNKAKATRAIMTEYRKQVDRLTDDRFLSPDIHASSDFIRNYFR